MPLTAFNSIYGVLPVVQTPFDSNDRIDAAILHREVDWLFECGANGIVMGMVSETTRLTDAERDELVQLLVQSARNRGPVIASVGDESSVQAVRHAQAAERLGATACMAIPPTLTRTANDEVAEYFRAILAATMFPLIIQDASGYLGNTVPIPVQVALWQEFDERVMFKPEAAPIGQNISALRDACDGQAKIFDGTGAAALIGNYHRGVAGTLPGSDLVWAVVSLWRALQDNDEQRAWRIQALLTAIASVQISLDAYLAVEKMLLVEQEIFISTRTRRPVGYVLDRESKQYVLKLFEQLRSICQV